MAVKIGGGLNQNHSFDGVGALSFIRNVNKIKRNKLKDSQYRHHDRL